MYKFLWKGPDKICRQTVIGEIEKGGLSMPDLKAIYKAQKINWIRRLWDKNVNHPWKLFFMRHVDKIGGIDLLLKCNFDLKTLQIKLPTFFHSMLSVWSEHNGNKINKDNVEGVQQIIWNNKEILLGRKSVYIPEFHDCGFIYIGDLF